MCNKNKGNKGEKISKQKLLKDCHQCQNVTVLTILEHLEFKSFIVVKPWWLTIIFSVPWPFHFEIYFSSPMLGYNYRENPVFCKFSSIVFFIILIFWICFFSKEIYEIDTNFIHGLTLMWKIYMSQPLKKYVRSVVGGGGLRNDGQKRKREWGWYNTYSKVNNQLMGAEFLFRLKPNFSFLFILQITRRVEARRWEIVYRNE